VLVYPRAVPVLQQHPRVAHHGAPAVLARCKSGQVATEDVRAGRDAHQAGRRREGELGPRRAAAQGPALIHCVEPRGFQKFPAIQDEAAGEERGHARMVGRRDGR